jgi:hypothetical protein
MGLYTEITEEIKANLKAVCLVHRTGSLVLLPLKLKAVIHFLKKKSVRDYMQIA